MLSNRNTYRLTSFSQLGMYRYSCKDTAVVIRYSDERTYARLCNQLEGLVPAENIRRVTAQSFEKTLKLSYEAALDMHRYWTIIIDADILLASLLHRHLLNAMKVMNDDDLGFSFLLWDRFYNAPKYRGLHIYRTKYLQKALIYIPREGSELRPEAYVKNRMSQEGHPWRRFGNIVGLHDYFQYPKDIFAKMAVRAHRSAEDNESLRFFFESQLNHPEFEVAYAGLTYGAEMKRENVTNSRDQYLEGYVQRFGNINESSIKVIMMWQIEIDLMLYKILLCTRPVKYFLVNQFKLIIK